MKTQVTRGEFGQIITGSGIVYDRALKILALARKLALIATTYDNTKWDNGKGKWMGTMLNADLYDVAPGAILMQHRHINMNKCGFSIKKDYFLITRQNGKITVTDRKNDKPKIMKLAKSGLPVGGVIAAIIGKKIATISHTTTKTAYAIYVDYQPDSGTYNWPCNGYIADCEKNGHNPLFADNVSNLHHAQIFSTKTDALYFMEHHKLKPCMAPYRNTLGHFEDGRIYGRHCRTKYIITAVEVAL